MKSESNVVYPLLSNGTNNPKYIDLCDEDPLIAGQKFVCVSFIAPEDILKRRELYLFQQFVQQWDMSKSMSKFQDFLNFICHKYTLTNTKVLDDFDEFIKEEETIIKASSRVVEDDFKNFMDKHEDRLTTQFSKDNNFQTSVRGLKIRGTFATQEEAERNCKKLRQNDPSHDIYVAPCGLWLPWDPKSDKISKTDYLEPELNRLHEEKIKNEVLAKEEFDQRIKDTKRKAIEENIRLAKKSGNKLTQSLDENGNLVGVNTMNFDDREVANEIDRELHEKSVMSKHDY